MIKHKAKVYKCKNKTYIKKFNKKMKLNKKYDSNYGLRARSDNLGKTDYYFVYNNGEKVKVSPYYYFKAAYLVYRNKKPPDDPKQRREYYQNLANLRKVLNNYK